MRNVNVKIKKRFVLMLMENVFQFYVLLSWQKFNVNKPKIVVIGVLKRRMIILLMRDVLNNALK